MEDHLNPEIIPQETAPVPAVPEKKISNTLLAGKGELVFAAAILACSILLCNFTMFGGFNLGFALTTAILIGCSWVYLARQGHKFDWYGRSLLILSLVIAAGFGYCADAFVKFILFLFLITAVNLAFCQAAGQNRYSPNGISSVLDAPRALFRFGFGNLHTSFGGVVQGLRSSGSAGRKTGSVVLGLVIAAPILFIMVPLLMDADAAFEGLLKLLPEIDLIEYFYSAFFGFFLGWILYSRGVSLNRVRQPIAPPESCAKMNRLTISTILTSVCLLYTVYLVSQLAYLSGGFSGILPEEFTVAEYARRGFFEMAWLCVINLLLVCGSVALVKKESGTPGFVKACCLFIGLVTIFLVATASAKMFLYIGSFGLTRLRVLTEVIMLWLAMTTVIILVWLFLPRLPYMKIVVLSAMVVGTAVFWVDVDTVVASYNVRAYQTGKLETVDMEHLGDLGISAVPYIWQLTEDPDEEIARQAVTILRRREPRELEFRDWSWKASQGLKVLNGFHEKENQQVNQMLCEVLGLEVPMGSLEKAYNYRPELEDGQQYLVLKLTDEEHDVFFAQLQSSEWKNQAVPDVLIRMVSHEDSDCDLFPEYDFSISSRSTIYYLFQDQHPDTVDPASPWMLFRREECKFLFAYYEVETQTLCFFRCDQFVIEGE